MTDLFNTGVRPLVDEYLLKEAQKKRDYGGYWSASSAGYCQRKLIFERLGVTPTQGDDARKTRVFEAGKIFHKFMQDITKEAGISIAQEVELQDEDLNVRGHFDDLILVDEKLILYDYKSQNSRAFSWQKKKGDGMSYYHHMQLGTYMLMLRRTNHRTTLEILEERSTEYFRQISDSIKNLSEGRILKISKDDLRLSEQQLMWSDDLEVEVKTYWGTLNRHWREKTIPPCTCADHEGGFMSKEAYNPFWYNGEPCSMEWYNKHKSELKEKYGIKN